MSSKFLIATLAAAEFLHANSMDATRFGARGDGKGDDTSALQKAIDSLPAGGVLNFGGPERIYILSSRLVFRPNRTYQGRATLRMSKGAPGNPAVAKLTYNASNNTVIEGLTFDANGVGGGLQIAVDGQAAEPAVHLQISHNIFRNTRALRGPWDSAIYDPVGLQESLVSFNRFVNCGAGVYVTDPSDVTISDNTFEVIHPGNAIFVLFAPAPFAYGQGLQILRNTGQHLGRMAIELWPKGGNVAETSVVSGAIISENTFSDWDPGYDSTPFGISVMAGREMRVENNSLMHGVSGMGIELGAADSVVQQNTIQEFAAGIVLQDSPGSTISNNLLSSQSFDGIELSNAPGSREAVTLTGNHIVNPGTFGIFVNTPGWGRSSITGNSITRQADLAVGGAKVFTGIGITPPNAPVTVRDNTIVQSGTSAPPRGFRFAGIRINGESGANASSVYLRNTIISRSQFEESVGVFGNSAGSLDGTILEGNRFEGLHAATAGAMSSKVRSKNNRVFDCKANGPFILEQPTPAAGEDRSR